MGIRPLSWKECNGEPSGGLVIWKELMKVGYWTDVGGVKRRNKDRKRWRNGVGELVEERV